jgi:hypothetical protein
VVRNRDSGPRQGRRIGPREELLREVAAWEGQRDEAEARIDGRFTTDAALIQLKKPYPSLVT